MKSLLLLLALLLTVSMNNFAQWSSDPAVNNAIALMSGEEAIPKVKTTPAGISYVAWFSSESGNYNVRLQKLDLFGNKLWADDGLLVSNHPAMTWLTDWDMAVDPAGYAYLTFQDIRNGDNDAFAYRISPEGESVWGPDGIELSTGPAFDAAPKVAVTSAGNAIFAWQADFVVIIQKIDPDGVKLWGDNGITLSTANTLSWPQLLPVGEDDMMLKYFEDSGPAWAPTRHVFAKRLGVDGSNVWSQDAIISNAGGISAWTQVFPMISDGNDGFYIAWHDDRDANNLSSTFVQHIASDGQVLLGDDGTEASTQAGRHNFYPQLALPEGSEDIFVYWNEMDADQNLRGIYGQKISPAGERLWGDNGKKFIEISSINVYPIGAEGAGNDMVVFFEEYFNAIDASVKAMRIDESGAYVWNDETISLCTVQSEKVHTEVSNFMFDQWIAVWEDSRNGGRDIYGQNIQLNGTIGSLPSDPEITISPDTLFITENAMDYYIYISNTGYVDYTIDTIIGTSDYWFYYELPEFPYTLYHNDSLMLTLPIDYVWGDNVNYDFVYDSSIVISSFEPKSSIVAFDMDILINEINPEHESSGIVYPNPSNSDVKFVLNESNNQAKELLIFDSKGMIISQQKAAATQDLIWDGNNSKGQNVSAGIYFYKIISGDLQMNGKLIRK